MNKMLILASRSMRRKQVLESAKIECIIKPVDIDYNVNETTDPKEVALIRAKRKAEAVFKIRPDALVLGVDTVVVVDGINLSKPQNEETAKGMLRLLSGKKHIVTTVCYLKSSEKSVHFCCETEVNFGEITEEEIEYYVNTGEVFDKAGAYAIQGYASRYIKGIKGDFYNVMGLPVYQLYHVLKEF